MAVGMNNNLKSNTYKSVAFGYSACSRCLHGSTLLHFADQTDGAVVSPNNAYSVERLRQSLCLLFVEKSFPELEALAASIIDNAAYYN